MDEPDKIARKIDEDAAAMRSGQKPGVRRRSFKRVNNVLNTVMRDLGLDRRLREHTLMNLWAPLVGEPFASRSRPLFIDAESKLVVAVADASTGQELSLLKQEILRKVAAAGRGVGVVVQGLRFDLKRYHNVAETDPERLPGRVLPKPTEERLASTVLTEEDLSELAKLKDGLGCQRQTGLAVSPERITAVFERELKLKRWMREAGYPLCASCKDVCLAVYGAERLCVTCRFSGRSEL